MQLQKLQSAIRAYKAHLLSQRFYEQQFKWRILKNFQEQWDIEAPDLAGMYDRSLQSDHTRRWWKSENFQPKEMMIHFLRASPEFGRRMFKDLFEEEKDLEGRISRFQFSCDVLLAEYKKDHPLTIDNNHFHSDSPIISLYLGLRYPEKYTLIFYPAFSTFLEKIGTRNIPGPFDFGRFFKICRTVNTFLQKEEGLADLHLSKLEAGKDFMGLNLWMVQDFYEFCSGREE